MLVTLQKGRDKIDKQKNIVFEIKTLDNMITRRIITTTKNAGLPFIISPVQLKILHYLFKHQTEFVYQGELEKIIDSRRSTTSGILSTMEKNQLIKRINSKKDARSKQIILTDYSYQLFKELQKEKDQFEAMASKSISKEELEIFFKVTEKIKNNIMNME